MADQMSQPVFDLAISHYDSDTTYASTEQSGPTNSKQKSNRDWKDISEKVWNYLSNHELPYESFAEGDDILNVLNLAIPFFNYACQGLDDDLQELRDSKHFTPEIAVECLADLLAQEMIAICYRAVEFESQVEKQMGVVDEPNSGSRLQNFIRNRANKSGRKEFFKEYPVLMRQLSTHATLWRNASREFLLRLHNDADELAGSLLSEDAGHLKTVMSLGDRHRGGRTVMWAQFSSGEHLIYKPRSLSIDNAFVDVLEWLHAKGGPDHRLPTTLAKDGYGWAEFIPTQACETEEEVHQFYERSGSLLALLYLTGATDFHRENIVACGAYPVPVDMETLLVPGGYGENDSDSINYDAILVDNVFRTGMLPNRLRLNQHAVAEDQSAIGGWESHIAITNPEVSEVEPSEVASSSRPQLGDSFVAVRDYASDIMDGFESTYRLVLKHRNELIDGGLLDTFSGLPLRVVLRNTTAYTTLLKDRYHPDLIRNADSTDSHFGRLHDTVMSDEADLKRIALAEIRALWDDDVPFFWTTMESRNLRSGDGECLPDMFQLSALDSTRQRLTRASEADLRSQSWLIQQCLGILPKTAKPLPVRETLDYLRGDGDPPRASTQTNAALFLAEACKIADQIQRTAFETSKSEPLRWTSFDDATTHWTILPSNNASLFSGAAGTALLHAYLGDVTEDSAYTEFSQRCLCGHEDWVLQDNVGGFSGLGGTAYTFAHLGQIWNDSTWFERATIAARQIPNHLEESRIFDIFSGVAGAIASMLSIYKLTKDSEFLDIADRCGQHLLQRSMPMQSGIGWSNGIGKALSGYGLGTAGIGWALLNLGKQTGKDSFLVASQDALAYERTLFVEEKKNWQDVRFARSGIADKPCAMAVCHGAPGIGLARAMSLPLQDDDQTRNEIRTAADTIARQGFGDAHCLCHGDLGNVESLMRCADALDDHGLRTKADEISRAIVKDGMHRGWRCGVPNYASTPDFLWGLGGISFTLLRWAAPDKVPFVLTLEPPKQ